MNSGEANYEFVPIQSGVERSLMLIVIKPPPLRSDGWPAASAVGETLRQGVGARSFVKLWARKSDCTDEREVAAATITWHYFQIVLTCVPVSPDLFQFRWRPKVIRKELSKSVRAKPGQLLSGESQLIEKYVTPVVQNSQGGLMSEYPSPYYHHPKSQFHPTVRGSKVFPSLAI